MARNREFNTEKVLDKAVGLFWDRGYNGVSTQELIDEFGISKSSMYGAFGDKMQLFIAALERYRRQISDDMSARLQQCSDIRKEIKNILTEIAQKALQDKPGKGCFVVNTCIELAPHHEEIATIVRDHHQRLETIFTIAIRNGIEKGVIPRSKDAVAISGVLCNAITGIQVDANYLKDKKYFDDVIRSVLAFLD
jgi:TetR/AcrR family transcriptional regulator, transcriptional repressor for nem operon